MPLEYRTKTSSYDAGLWNMTEPAEELMKSVALSAEEKKTLASFSSKYRQREWLTVRALLNELLNGRQTGIGYGENGKPYLRDAHESISISHTRNYVSLLITNAKACGIDVETIQPRIEKIAKRFVTDDENKFIEQDQKIIYQHVIWGAKETLFKIYGTGELNFLEHLHVKPFSLQRKGVIEASIRKNEFQQDYRLHYERRGELMLTYGMNDE